MQKRIVIVNYKRCRPSECSNGCKAAQACKRSSLKQYSSEDIPFAAGLCKGCFDCIRACKLSAVQKG